MYDSESRVGVFVCNCGLNIASTVDCADVAKFAGTLNGVAHAVNLLFACSDDGQATIQEAIKKYNLTGVVVASCTPRTHEPVFRKCVEDAGLNRYLYDQVNIREHVSWVHMKQPELATKKAKHLVAMSVERVKRLLPLHRQSVNVIPKVAVIGAGVAGISASLDLANAGFETHLIERRPTVGGQMALLDKVFPQNDCAICILGPIMAEVGQHPNIKLHTYSEVDEVDGYVGNFNMKVRKKSRYIDIDKCNGCGDCEPVCPVTVTNSYDFGLSERKAVYRPFPQSVPNRFTIEKLGHAACRIACPAHVNVQGFVALLGDGKFDKALALYRESTPFPGVLGRVCTSPCEVKCERSQYEGALNIKNLHRFLADKEMADKSNKVEPYEITKKERVAVVGAGPAGIACAHDLVKQGYSVTIFESKRQPGGLLRYGIPEYRLPRNILKEEIDRVRKLGVEIQTGVKVESLSDLKKEGYKAFFLATGAPGSRKMRIENENTKGVYHAIDFLERVNGNRKVEIGQSVIVVGGGNAAIDAARTARRMGARVDIVYRRSREEMPAISSEIEEAENEGVKIKFLTNPTRVLVKDGVLSGVECIKMRLGEPDQSGRRRPVLIPDSEFKLKADNIIIAIGQEVVKAPHIDGLEQTMWGTISVNPTTMETSTSGVFAGGDLVSGGSTVIDAIHEGKEAAISIDRYLSKTDLMEGRPESLHPLTEVTINPENVKYNPRASMPTLSARQRKDSFDEVELGFDEALAVAEANRCLSCAVCSECMECVEACKLEAIDHTLEDEIIELDVGAIIVATGFKIHDPLETREYGYGTFENVITNAQMERITNAAGPTKGKIKRPSDHEVPKSVAFIQCVGSRDRRIGQDYCCYIGCENSLKQATQIKEKYPDTEVAIYAMDIRTHGLGYEGLYHRARGMGVVIIKGRPSEIEEISDTKSLKVLAEDLYTGELLGTSHDLVVLASAIHPHEDTKELARKMKLSLGEYGFLLEAHPKLRPVDAFQDGIFLAGACLGPMDIPKAVAYGKAAAAGAQALLAPGVFKVEPNYAEIDTDLCIDCELCAEICPYGAITGEKEERRVVSELCAGCGTCAAGCPQNAIDIHHYKRDQLLPQIIAAARFRGGV